jgi:hypothetical protein
MQLRRMLPSVPATGAEHASGDGSWWAILRARLGLARADRTVAGVRSGQSTHIG